MTVASTLRFILYKNTIGSLVLGNTRTIAPLVLIYVVTTVHSFIIFLVEINDNEHSLP